MEDMTRIQRIKEVADSIIELKTRIGKLEDQLEGFVNSNITITCKTKMYNNFDFEEVEIPINQNHFIEITQSHIRSIEKKIESLKVALTDLVKDF